MTTTTITKTEKMVSIRVQTFGGLWRTIEVPASQVGPTGIAREGGRDSRAIKSAGRPNSWTR